MAGLVGGDTNENSVGYSKTVYIGYSMGNLADTDYMVLYIGQQEGVTIGNITVVTITLAGSSSSCASVNLVNVVFIEQGVQ